VDEISPKTKKPKLFYCLTLKINVQPKSLYKETNRSFESHRNLRVIATVTIAIIFARHICKIKTCFSDMSSSPHSSEPRSHPLGCQVELDPDEGLITISQTVICCSFRCAYISIAGRLPFVESSCQDLETMSSDRLHLDLTNVLNAA